MKRAIWVGACAIALVLGLTWAGQRPVATAADTTPPASLPNLKAGDKVIVHFPHNDPWVRGTVTAVDAGHIGLTGNVAFVGGSRDVEYWVPFNSVLYVEKILKEEFDPPPAK